MSSRFITFLVLSLGRDVLSATNTGCSLDARGGEEKYMPVLLDNSSSKFEFLLPHRGKIDLRHGEPITLACPDNKNYIVNTQSNSTYATCVQGETLKLIRKNEEFNLVRCVYPVHGGVVTTNKRCGNKKGIVINIGYAANKREFLTLIQVCYDVGKAITLYTEHLLYGEEISFASKSMYRPHFRPEGSVDVSVSMVYKQTFQKTIFKNLLGSEFIDSKSYLARGHLSPDADFIYAPWQYTTYYFINAVPQWQAVNNGNWKRIEYLTRRTADTLGETLKIFTGTHQILSLPDEDGQDTDIYLISGNRLPVPKFVWKILYSEKSNSGIAFVILNNPFAENKFGTDMLCENVCDRYGWGNKLWDRYEKGFVHCCEVKDLLKVLRTGPNIRIRSVLRQPN